MKTQKGNAAVIALIIVVVAITTGVITWLVATRTQAPVVQTQPVIQPLTPSTIYNISNLGIQFSLPAPLSDLTDKIVHLEGDQAVNSVGFSSKRLEAAGCSVESAPLGYLTYDNDKGGVIVGNARGSNLYYIPPSGQCQVATVSQDWRILQEALKSLVTDYKGN